MSYSRNEDLYNNYLDTTAIRTERLKISANTAFMNNSLLGQLYFFVTLGCFLFIFPYFKIHLLTTSSPYAIIILYLMAPAQNIAQLIPHLNHAEISISRLEQLNLRLSEDKQAPQIDRIHVSNTFESLIFDRAGYTYGNNTSEKTDFFKVGPFDLRFDKNEIVFISGANGSGKSTFIRLMTGLYYPTEGSILFNNVKITEESIQSYRDMISVVFTDGYLFDILYGIDDADSSLMQIQLQKMRLDKKVTFENGRFSDTNLSDGQKKRLLLASSLMENKPIIVFDELAANQDPEFKKYFYYTLLPELKSRQKTVIVVTHDDHYFNCADRHIIMENGHISILTK